MATPVPFNTRLTEEQLTTIFQRVLNDMTDEQINTKFAEITGEITAVKTRLTALETPETEVEENA